MDPAIFFSHDQAGIFEHAQVLGDGGEGHVERFRQLADRAFVVGEFLEDGPSRGIGQGREDRIEPIRFILNHEVKCTAWEMESQEETEAGAGPRGRERELGKKGFEEGVQCFGHCRSIHFSRLSAEESVAACPLDRLPAYLRLLVH